MLAVRKYLSLIAMVGALALLQGCSDGDVTAEQTVDEQGNIIQNTNFTLNLTITPSGLGAPVTRTSSTDYDKPIEYDIKGTAGECAMRNVVCFLFSENKAGEYVFEECVTEELLGDDAQGTAPVEVSISFVTSPGNKKCYVGANMTPE